jgi:hypothetical protein
LVSDRPVICPMICRCFIDFAWDDTRIYFITRIQIKKDVAIASFFIYPNFLLYSDCHSYEVQKNLSFRRPCEAHAQRAIGGNPENLCTSRRTITAISRYSRYFILVSMRLCFPLASKFGTQKPQAN